MLVRDRRGIALMLALWLIIVLGTVGAAVANSARSSTSVAANLRARAVGRYAAESGVIMASGALQDSLAAFNDAGMRKSYLNTIETAGARWGEMQLGGARFAVTYIDVNARLDVNNSTREQLSKIFSFFTSQSEAVAAATAIRNWIGAEDATSNRLREYTSSRTDLSFPVIPAARPLRSLETLRLIPGIPEQLARATTPHLTVDGDGRINRITASDTVLAAAAGSLETEPSRVLVIARGWLDGQPLTYEIQAAYAIEGNSIVLVRWREREL